MANTNTGVSFIYAIRANTTRSIKIGFSNDVERRLRDLQCACPEELEIIACWKGTMAEEQAIHAKLNDHRQHREWFSPSDEVLALIKAKDQSYPGRIKGKLAIDTSKVDWIEFWTNCRLAEEAKRQPIKDELRCGFCCKRQSDVLMLAAGRGVYICNECVPVAVDLMESNAALRAKAEDTERHMYRVGSIGQWYYSARSKEEALTMWLLDPSIDRKLSDRVLITKEPDGDLLTMHHHNAAGEAERKESATYAEWAARTIGRLGYVIGREGQHVRFVAEVEMEKTVEELRAEVVRKEQEMVEIRRAALAEKDAILAAGERLFNAERALRMDASSLHEKKLAIVLGGTLALIVFAGYAGYLLALGPQ